MINLKNKICCFAEHRYEWNCAGIDDNLLVVLEDLVIKGYTIFYDGGYGHSIKNVSMQL